MGKLIRFRALALIFPFAALGNAAAQPPPVTPKTETIVFIRHGEKPASDEGQLSCQGLNRALALPAVLDAKFGHPDFIFAPLTTKKKGREGTFSYVRPLITIEPTAIRAGLPVETRIAYDDLGSLQGELCEKQYQQATIFVAWEHKQLDEVVRRLVSAFGGNEKDVPDWPTDDFDSIFVVRLRDDPQGKKSITFEHDHEGLNGLSTDYPIVAPNPTKLEKTMNVPGGWSVQRPNLTTSHIAALDPGSGLRYQCVL